MSQMLPFTYFDFNVGDELYVHTLPHLLHHSGWYRLVDRYILDVQEEDFGWRRMRQEPMSYAVSEDLYIKLCDNLTKYEEWRKDWTIPNRIRRSLGSKDSNWVYEMEGADEDEYLYFTRNGITPIENYRHNKEWKPYLYMVDTETHRGMWYYYEFHYVLEDESWNTIDIRTLSPFFKMPEEIEEGDAAERLKASSFFSYDGRNIPLISDFECSTIELFEEIYKPNMKRVRI